MISDDVLLAIFYLRLEGERVKIMEDNLIEVNDYITAPQEVIDYANDLRKLGNNELKK